MKEKIIVLILGLFLVSLLVPFMDVPVYAAEVPIEIEMGDKVILDSGDTSVFLGKSGDEYRYMATLGAPRYIPGTTTEIDTSWHYDTVKGEWSSGANMFDAIVKGEKVTVFKDGQKMSWEPSILVGTKDTKAVAKEPILLPQDPINENYWGNTLEWDYGVAKRHLRIIEGVLLELWIFEENPGVDIQVKSNLIKDANFIWDRNPFAYDSKGEPIKVSLDKIVLASEFARLDITYPVTIDPTSTFTTSSSDGYGYGKGYLLGSESTAWNTAHDGSASSVSYSGTTLLSGIKTRWIGEEHMSAFIWRGFIYFDTSSLPNDATIDTAILKLYGSALPDTDWGAWTLKVQSGMPTYPSNPMVTSTFNYNYYSGDGGTLASGSMGIGYKDLTLNATGESWINLEGDTKFILRETEHDIADSKPSSWSDSDEYNLWRIYTYEAGDGYWPQLVITYTASNPPTVTPVAASDISTTTAKLHGYLGNDGGEECQVMFEYDTDSGVPYASNTGWLATNYTTGQSFEKVIESLNVDDTYYFRAIAKNAAGTTNSTELSFTTLATLNPPTNLKGIPKSNTEVSLSWVKGIGSSQTMVRYKEGEYPSTTGGELACNITKTSYSLGDLTPGTTYYIRAWGYDAGAFSATNMTEMATTLAGSIPPESPITVPLIPSNFFGPSTYTNLSNLPVYSHFNTIADTIGMPRENFWMYLIFALAIVLGAAFFMMTKQPIFAIIGTSLGIGYGYLAGPIPGWILLIYVIAAGSIAFVLLKGGEGYA